MQKGDIKTREARIAELNGMNNDLRDRLEDEYIHVGRLKHELKLAQAHVASLRREIHRLTGQPPRTRTPNQRDPEATLRADLAEALGMLRELEYPVLDTNEDPMFCQFCGAHRRTDGPHRGSCRLAALLEKHK